LSKCIDIFSVRLAVVVVLPMLSRIPIILQEEAEGLSFFMQEGAISAQKSGTNKVRRRFCIASFICVILIL